MSTVSLPAVPGPIPFTRAPIGVTAALPCRRCGAPEAGVITLRTPQVAVPVCQLCAIVLVGGFADRVVVELVIPAPDLVLAP